jgi:hypothetical protein
MHHHLRAAKTGNAALRVFFSLAETCEVEARRRRADDPQDPPTTHFFFSSTLMLLLALSSSSLRLSFILLAFIHFFLSSSQVFGRRSSGCSPLPTLSRGPEKKAAATHSFHEMRLVEATLLASSSGHQPRRKRDRVHPSLPSLPPRCMVARSPFIIIIPFFFLLVSFFFHLLPFSPLLLGFFFSPPPASTHPLVGLIQREWVERGGGHRPLASLSLMPSIDASPPSTRTVCINSSGRFNFGRAFSASFFSCFSRFV